MKKLFVSFLFALTFISATTSFAKSSFSLTQVPEELYFDTNVYVEPDAVKLNVGVTKEIGTRLVVKIIDPAGMTIHYRQLSVYEAYSHVRFDLSQLADGHYELVITDGETEEVKDFQILNAPSNSGVRGIMLKQ